MTSPTYKAAAVYEGDPQRLVILRRRLRHEGGRKFHSVADLINYWIEKAEKELESEATKSAGASA